MRTRGGATAGSRSSRRGDKRRTTATSLTTAQISGCASQLTGHAASAGTSQSSGRVAASATGGGSTALQACCITSFFVGLWSTGRCIKGSMRVRSCRAHRAPTPREHGPRPRRRHQTTPPTEGRGACTSASPQCHPRPLALGAGAGDGGGTRQGADATTQRGEGQARPQKAARPGARGPPPFASRAGAPLPTATLPIETRCWRRRSRSSTETWRTRRGARPRLAGLVSLACPSGRATAVARRAAAAVEAASSAPARVSPRATYSATRVVRRGPPPPRSRRGWGLLLASRA